LATRKGDEDADRHSSWHSAQKSRCRAFSLEHVYRIAKSAFLPIGTSIGEPNRHFWRQIGIGIGLSAQNAEKRADRHSHRLSELPINGRRPEVAGDFYMITIMVMLMIIMILHHGADDYNHMAMQGDLQLGLHDGGY